MTGSQIVFLALIGVVLALIGAWLYYGRPETQVVSAIIAGAATIVAGVAVVGITQYNTKLREIREGQRLQKTEVYSEFSDMVFYMLTMTKISGRSDLSDSEKTATLVKMQAELQDRYMSFSKKLLLWGSPEVMKAWLAFRLSAQSQVGSSDVEAGLRTFLYVDDVFRAIRDDLELSNEGLAEGDLVKQFLIDPGELDRVIGTR